MGIPKPAPAPAPAPAPDAAKPAQTQPWDIVVTVIVCIGCVLFLTGNILLIKFRNWSPIKYKGVLLTTLSSLGGLVWVVSTVVVLRHFPRNDNTILSQCSLWTFWLWACFGFGLWLNCLTVRMLQLYLIFVKGFRLVKREFFKWTILPLLVLLSPSIIVSLVATPLKAVRYKQAIQDCSFEDDGYKFAITIICLIPLYFLIFLWFAFQLRNIMSQWNEFRQIRIGGIMSFFLFLLSLVTLQSKVHYKVPGRCFLTLAVAGAVFYYFWARNWDVIYQVLFNKSNFEQQFGRELNRFNSDSARNPDFETNQMEKLVLDTKEEASKHHREMEQLQSDVNLLKLQLGKHQELAAAL